MNLTVTDGALRQFQAIMDAREVEPGHAIRIFAQGGGCGCSGANFGMGFDAASGEDAVVTVGALTFIVDPASAPALEDASIDYVEDVMQAGFAIEAPNAGVLGGGGGCGCGAR